MLSPSSRATQHVGNMHASQFRLLTCTLGKIVVNARDAWIQADANRYGGANKCILWRAFASRGLGVNAKNFVDDSSVPAGC